MSMSEDKKEESPIMIKNVNKMDGSLLENQNIKEILKNQETLEHEL